MPHSSGARGKTSAEMLKHGYSRLHRRTKVCAGMGGRCAVRILRGARLCTMSNQGAVVTQDVLNLSAFHI